MSYQFGTTTSFSDETYLESFVESISASLPNELRRNLEHLHDLDNTSCKLMEDWRERQDGCLNGVEETLLNVLRGEAAAAAAADASDGGNDSPKPGNNAAGGKIPASQEKRGTKRKQHAPEQTPEKKVACLKCRAKKVRCDGKQPYCLRRPPSDDESDSDDDDDDDKSVKMQKDAKEEGVGSKVENNVQGPLLSQHQVSAFLRKRGPPTNEEIRTALHTHNPQYSAQREEITSMYHELQQFSNEKISTVNQLKSMIDMALGRLNRDLESFEKELGIDNNLSTTAVGANSMGGGLGGIAGGGLGMVGHHNAHVASGGARMGAGVHAVGNNSSVASMAPSAATAPIAATANNPSSLRRSSSSTSAMRPPPTSSAMQQPYPSTMRGIVPPPPKSVQSSNLAAIQVTPNSPDWILAKILSHDKPTKMYTLSDEDLQSNQIYKIPEKQVVVLKGTERNKWPRGDVVYAVYPDTTSFYHATVSTPPLNGFVMVQFKDDWDANGVTHEKAVLMAHVMKVPPGKK